MNGCTPAARGNKRKQWGRKGEKEVGRQEGNGRGREGMRERVGGKAREERQRGRSFASITVSHLRKRTSDVATSFSLMEKYTSYCSYVRLG